MSIHKKQLGYYNFLVVDDLFAFDLARIHALYWNEKTQEVRAIFNSGRDMALGGMTKEQLMGFLSTAGSRAEWSE